MHGIRTITFDLDDTLWPIKPVIERADRRLYSWLGEHYPRITEKFSKEGIFEVRNKVVHEYADQIHDLTFLRKTVLGRISEAAGYGTRMVDDAFAILKRNAISSMSFQTFGPH